MPIIHYLSSADLSSAPRTVVGQLERLRLVLGLTRHSSNVLVDVMCDERDAAQVQRGDTINESTTRSRGAAAPRSRASERSLAHDAHEPPPLAARGGPPDKSCLQGDPLASRRSHGGARLRTRCHSCCTTREVDRSKKSNNLVVCGVPHILLCAEHTRGVARLAAARGRSRSAGMKTASL